MTDGLRVAFGFRPHSGWSALVTLARSGSDLVILQRRRIELVDAAWAKQPYHAAEKLEPRDARTLVERGVGAAHEAARAAMKALVEAEENKRNRVAGCAVLVGNPMPGWSVDEILAVHLRRHQAEGVLFRAALLAAAGNCGVRAIAIPEKELEAIAARELKRPINRLRDAVTRLGKSAGPPWGKDQKDAALAAWVALETHAA